ncbi:MAG: hypothetical protein AAF642_02270 [Pseudomonadota bacterium]
MIVDNAQASQSGMFAARDTIEQVEGGYVLAPKFDANGWLACIITDVQTGELLMLGYIASL